MATYQEVLRQAKKDAFNTDATEQSIMLLMHSIASHHNINLFANYMQEIDPTINQQFDDGFQRLLKGEPLDYVLGYTPFYGYDFIVDSRVLIPRVETEELVAHALALLDDKFSNVPTIDVADVGCGSGAIGISVALEEPKVHLIASDISEDALEVAKLNAEKLGVNVSFYQGDMAKPIIEANKKVDVLLCNPPYIPSDEQMEKSVVEYEPHVALFGGKDGFQFYRSVLKDANQLLKGNGYGVFEIGYDQKEGLLEIVKQLQPQANAKVIKDMNGKDRILIVEFNYENN